MLAPHRTLWHRSMNEKNCDRCMILKENMPQVNLNSRSNTDKTSEKWDIELVKRSWMRNNKVPEMRCHHEIKTSGYRKWKPLLLNLWSPIKCQKHSDQNKMSKLDLEWNHVLPITLTFTVHSASSFNTSHRHGILKVIHMAVEMVIYITTILDQSLVCPLQLIFRSHHWIRYRYQWTSCPSIPIKIEHLNENSPITDLFNSIHKQPTHSLATKFFKSCNKGHLCNRHSMHPARKSKGQSLKHYVYFINSVQVQDIQQHVLKYGPWPMKEYLLNKKD